MGKIDYRGLAIPKTGETPKTRRAARRRAALKAAGKDRDGIVFRRDGGRCAGWGVNPHCSGQAVDPHELIPVGIGGQRISSNRVGLCRSCHRETQGRVGGLRLRFFWAWPGPPNADMVGSVLPWWDATAGKDGGLIVSVFYLQPAGLDGKASVYTCLKRGYLLQPLTGSSPRIIGLVDMGTWEPYAATVLAAFLGFRPIPAVVTHLAGMIEQRVAKLDAVRAILADGPQVDDTGGTALGFLRSDLIEVLLDQIDLGGVNCWRCGDTGTNQDAMPCSCAKGRLQAEQEGAAKRGE